jgi:hypothetical protein
MERVADKLLQESQLNYFAMVPIDDSRRTVSLISKLLIY